MSNPVPSSLSTLPTTELPRLLGDVGAELTARGEGHGPVVEQVDAMVALDTARATLDAVAAQWASAFEQVDGPAEVGCASLTHLEIHHPTPWIQGGPTDLGNLGGYCTRCHHLIHAGRPIVTVRADGRRDHRTRHARLLPQHHRRSRRRIEHYLRTRLNPRT